MVLGRSERRHVLPAPPLWGSRIGAADPRGVKLGEEFFQLDPPPYPSPTRGEGKISVLPA